MLLIVTFRPEFNAPWIGRPYVTALTINRLGQRDIDAMIDHVVGNKGLPASIRQEIIDRTDGIPLFVEEMTKAVLESRRRGRSAADRRRGPVTGGGGPRELARVAYGAARPARPGQGGRADRGGDRASVFLCAAGFVGTPAGGGTGIGVGPSHCRRLAVPPGRAAPCDLPLQACPGAGHGLWHASCAVNARSCTRVSPRCLNKTSRKWSRGSQRLSSSLLAGRPGRSCDQVLGRAGARSADRSAHHEAVGHFECALDLLGKLPPSHQRDERELELTLALAVSLIAVHGFGSIRVEECAIRAKELSDKLSRSQNRFAAQRLAWNSSLMRQPVPRTTALATDLVGLAEEDGESGKTRHGVSGIRLLAPYCRPIPRGCRTSCSGSGPRRHNFARANSRFTASIQAWFAEPMAGRQKS